MSVLIAIVLMLGLTFTVFGYLIYFKKKYNLINDFEKNYKAGRVDQQYAQRVGFIELSIGIVLLVSGIVVLMLRLMHKRKDSVKTSGLFGY